MADPLRHVCLLKWFRRASHTPCKCTTNLSADGRDLLMVLLCYFSPYPLQMAWKYLKVP